MLFLVIGRDGCDSEALQRRAVVRDAHLKLGDKLIESGNLLYGVAHLDNEGNMKGSTYVCDFPSRADLDKWLEQEPYVVGNVWQEIEVMPCKVGPAFLKK